MHCNILGNGKEFSTAKGATVTTDFGEFKDISLKKNEQDIKWEEFKVKNIKLEHTKSTNIIIVF